MDSAAAQDEARKQWKIDQTGPLSLLHLPQLIGFFKSDAILNSREFRELDPDTRKALQADTKPNYEIYSVNKSLAHSQANNPPLAWRDSV